MKEHSNRFLETVKRTFKCLVFATVIAFTLSSTLKAQEVGNIKYSNNKEHFFIKKDTLPSYFINSPKNIIRYWSISANYSWKYEEISEENLEKELWLNIVDKIKSMKIGDQPITIVLNNNKEWDSSKWVGVQIYVTPTWVVYSYLVEYNFNNGVVTFSSERFVYDSESGTFKKIVPNN